MTTQAKFAAVESHLNSIAYERTDEIRALLSCVVTNNHMFMLGLPGLGKSFLMNEFAKIVSGARKFDKLMTSHTDVSEIFGPPSIAALKNDKLEFATQGFAADCELVFLDECFKANSQVLNSLLTLMEERKFANGNSNIKAPLISMIGASNELPADDSLKALYDRFIVRVIVNPLQGDDNFKSMILGQMSDDAPPELTLEDIQAAQSESSKIPFEDMLSDLVDLRAHIAYELSDRVYVSDRRWKKCVKYLQGVSWMIGANEVTKDSFIYLLDCLWCNPDDRSAIATILSTYVSPVVDRTKSLLDEIISFKEIAMKCNSIDELASLKSQIETRIQEIECKMSDPNIAPHVNLMLTKAKDADKEVKTRYRKLIMR